MTIKEHKEFAEEINQTRRLLVKKRSLVSENYDVTHETTKLVQKTIDNLDKLKWIMDDIYCKEYISISPYFGA